MKKIYYLLTSLLFSFISLISFAQVKNCPSVVDPAAMQTNDPGSLLVRIFFIFRNSVFFLRRYTTINFYQPNF